MKPEEILRAATSAPIIEQFEVPPRPERLRAVPKAYGRGPVADWLREVTRSSGKVWNHQAIALEAIEQGLNVITATGTASGKSLTFQAPVILDLFARNPSTTLVLFPQIALAGDQMDRWHAALEKAGLPLSLVGQIHGEVSQADREKALSSAQVVVATPDVVNAYFMANLNAPLIRGFLQRLRRIVVDEAHELNGVFGSNSAFLFRRLRLAVARARQAAGIPSLEPQYIAASATITDAANHMETLTGVPFVAVEESENGAPFHGREFQHIEGPDHGATAEATLAAIVGNIAGSIAPDAVIAFYDARQGAERVAARIGREDVEPYRSGFGGSDRASIQRGLREGTIRGIIATSALELGVDFPQFSIAINVGVPQSVKSIHQRAGRAGRAGQAIVAVLAPANAFTSLGVTFRELYEAEAERSTLYLENEILQFQQALCLLDELGAGEEEAELPPGIDWPEGFEKAFALAQPGAIRPSSLNQMVQQLAARPQHTFSLRSIANGQLALRLRESGERIGTIDADKALREAFPGATFLQRKKPYRVFEWRETTYERSIYVAPVQSGPPTVPMLRTQVSVSHQGADLLEGNLLTGKKGSLAETCLQVTESVEGYAIGNNLYPYRELSAKDPRKSRKQRQFSTTGVVVSIDEPWFKGPGEKQTAMRKAVGLAFAGLLTRERSIARGEIGSAHINIALYGQSGPRRVEDTVVIFDDLSGGLRLTEPLFSSMAHFLQRLRKGAEMAGSEALLDELTVRRLERWYASLEASDPARLVIPNLEEGERMVYAAGSLVGVRINGTLAERRLLGHQLLPFAGREHLVYLYESETGVTALVPHDQIEPVGHEWRHVLWDPSSDTLREIAA